MSITCIKSYRNLVFGYLTYTYGICVAHAEDVICKNTFLSVGSMVYRVLAMEYVMSAISVCVSTR